MSILSKWIYRFDTRPELFTKLGKLFLKCIRKQWPETKQGTAGEDQGGTLTLPATQTDFTCARGSGMGPLGQNRKPRNRPCARGNARIPFSARGNRQMQLTGERKSVNPSRTDGYPYLAPEQRMNSRGRRGLNVTYKTLKR